MQRNTSNEIKVGIVVVVFALCSFLVLFSLKGFKKDKGSKYIVQFAQAGGISPGDNVRYAGINIGKVTNVQIRKSPVYNWDRKSKSFIKILDQSGMPLEKDQAFVTIMITDISAFGKEKPVFTDKTEISVTTSFMNERWIEIRPSSGGTPVSPGGTLLGRKPVNVEEIMAKAGEAIDRFSDATGAINEILGDKETQKNIKLSLENFKELTSSLKEVSENVRMRINGIADRVELLTDNANRVVLNVNGIVKRSSSKVDNITTNLSKFSSTLNRIGIDNEKDIRVVVKNLSQVSKSLKNTIKTIEILVTKKEFSEDILTTLKNVKNASREVEGIASDIRSLTSDDKIKEDVKVVISEAKSAATGANRLIKSINRTLGIDKAPKKNSSKRGQQNNKDLIGMMAGKGNTWEGYSGDDEKDKTKNKDINKDSSNSNKEDNDVAKINLNKIAVFDLEAEYNDKTKETVPNANVILLPESKTSFKIGIDSAGFDNLFNLQYRSCMGAFSPRVGIIRSKLGAGADLYMGKVAGLFVDAYDPRDWQVDLTGRINVTRSGFYLHGGVRDVFDKKRAVFGVGKRF